MDAKKSMDVYEKLIIEDNIESQVENPFVMIFLSN